MLDISMVLDIDVGKREGRVVRRTRGDLRVQLKMLGILNAKWFQLND